MRINFTYIPKSKTVSYRKIALLEIFFTTIFLHQIFYTAIFVHHFFFTPIFSFLLHQFFPKNRILNLKIWCQKKPNFCSKKMGVKKLNFWWKTFV